MSIFARSLWETQYPDLYNLKDACEFQPVLIHNTDPGRAVRENLFRFCIFSSLDFKFTGSLHQLESISKLNVLLICDFYSEHQLCHQDWLCGIPFSTVPWTLHRKLHCSCVTSTNTPTERKPSTNGTVSLVKD